MWWMSVRRDRQPGYPAEDPVPAGADRLIEVVGQAGPDSRGHHLHVQQFVGAEARGERVELLHHRVELLSKILSTSPGDLSHDASSFGWTG